MTREIKSMQHMNHTIFHELLRTLEEVGGIDLMVCCDEGNDTYFDIIVNMTHHQSGWCWLLTYYHENHEIHRGKYIIFIYPKVRGIINDFCKKHNIYVYERDKDD